MNPGKTKKYSSVVSVSLVIRVLTGFSVIRELDPADGLDEDDPDPVVPEEIDELEEENGREDLPDHAVRRSEPDSSDLGILPICNRGKSIPFWHEQTLRRRPNTELWGNLLYVGEEIDEDLGDDGRESQLSADAKVHRQPIRTLMFS